jgi:integrase
MKVRSETTRITKASVEAAWRRRGGGQRLIVRDKECRGLALIVNATSMTWGYSYRPRGVDPSNGKRWPNRTITLGNPASHSVEGARAEANRIKGQAAAGGDPAADKKAKAEAERWKRATTLIKLVDEYARVLPRRPKMRGHGLPSPQYVAEELAQLRMALRDMQAEAKPAADLTDANVRALLDSSEGVRTAGKRFGALSRFLDWCQDAGHVKANPCAQIARSRRPRAPQARAHYLTPVELARLWHAAERLDEPVWRDLARFLIAVPCRRGEARRLDWAHVDLYASEWRQPRHVTKNRDPHRLHLHSLALQVLRARQDATGGNGLVFPAPKSGGPVDTFSKIKMMLNEVPGLSNWTWHDFRRSFATALGEAGIPEVVADAVLNHRQSATRGGVLGVYQRASRWPEQARAMELWGQLLAAAVESQEADANVMLIAAGSR